jgi:WD40 repeat protein
MHPELAKRSGMQLENEQILGQGGISHLTAIGTSRGLVVAAVRNELRIFAAIKLYEKRNATLVLGSEISALAADPQAAKNPARHLFASGERKGRLVVWGVNEKSKPLAAAERQLDAAILDLSWSMPNQAGGSALAAALSNGSIALWWPDEDRLRTIQVGDEAVLSVSWFPDGQHLASSGEDGVLRVWKLPETSQAKDGLLRHYNAIRRVRVSACGRYVAFVSEDEKGTVFDLSRRESTAFGQPGDPVVSLAWHPREARIAAGTQLGQTLVHDVEQGLTELGEKQQHLHPAEAVCWSPTGSKAHSAGRCGMLVTWEKVQDSWMGVLTHNPKPKGYALSVGWAKGDAIAAGYSNGQVALWEKSQTGYEYKPLEASHTKPVYGLAVSNDGATLATGAVDHLVKVWDVGEKMQAHNLSELHNKPVYGVAFSPDGRYLATGSGDTYLVVYDIAAMKKKAKEAFGKDEYWHFAVRNKVLNCVAWSPAGHTIAVGLSNHSVVLLPVTKNGEVTKGPTLKGHADSVSAVAFSPDGAWLASAGYDRRVVIWDVATGQAKQQRIVEHQEPIQCLAVHPGGRVVATGSWDGSIRLWKASDLSPIASVTGPPFSAVEGLSFNTKGTRLAVASSDGTIGIWKVKT